MTRRMVSMLHRYKAAFLLLILAVAPSSGSAQQGTREVMATAMARMMEAMGLFDTAPAGRGGAGWGSATGLPWGSSVPSQSPAYAMRDLMHGFAPPSGPQGRTGSDWPIAWEPSRLEGVWEGRDGELLIVQGRRFRIYSPATQRIDGLMKIQGDRLALYNPLDQHAQPFEFNESQNRLIMRDLTGQIYLYRRLRLDGLDPRAGTHTLTDR